MPVDVVVGAQYRGEGKGKSSTRSSGAPPGVGVPVGFISTGPRTFDMVDMGER